MAEDSSPQDKIKQLDDRLRYLETVARDTVARLYEIEKHLGLVFHAVPRELNAEIERGAQASPAGKPLEKPSTPTGTSAPDIVSGMNDQPPGEASTAESPSKAEGEPERSPAAGETLPPSSDLRVPRAPASIPQTVIPQAPAGESPAVMTRIASVRRPRGEDLEARIGGNWFNRIGIIAICFGVAFFLKYAFDNQWIGPAGRVAIGVVIGIGFLMGGERLRRRYPSYAYGLTGGGVLILYLSIFAASENRYDLISQKLAFVLMATVTAIASLLSARYSALPIALLGLIGGFLTPILLSTGVDNEKGLFGYIALLDAGVLALAYTKQWRSLNYLAFGSTVAMFVAWGAEWYSPEKLGTTVFFLTLFFTIFALLAVLYNVVNRRPTGWLDLAMVFSNALLYFSVAYELLDDQYHSALGLFAVVVAAFYLALGYFTYRRDREDRLLVFTFLGLGFLFSVLAVPIQFNQYWVTIGWAVEGAVMTWVGLRANDRTSRYASIIVFFIAVSHWLLVDVPDFAYLAPAHFAPLLNRRALSCAVLVAALAAASFFYKRYGEKLEGKANFSSLLLLGANALAVTLLSIDANDYFEQRKALASGREYASSLGNTKALMLTLLWTIYGAGALFVGITRRLKALRILALVLLAGATLKVLLVDLRYYDASWHTLIANQTFAAFSVIITALAFGAWFYKRGEEADKGERDLVLPLLIAVMNLLAVVALSAEVLGHFDRIGSGLAHAEADRIESTKQFVISAVWTIYGAVALVVGIRRGTGFLRTGSLMLLTLTTFKILTVDLSYYGAEWHTLLLNQTFAAFALLVYALASSARSYARAESVGERERSAMVPLLVASANVLALVALSAEALGYYTAKMSGGDLSSGTRGDLHLAQQLSLSMVWTVYGGAMLTAGIARRSKLLRVMALLLLGLTILKVFLFDLSSLQKLYRIISFIVLGAILLGVSFLYQRYRQRVAEGIGESHEEGPVRSESH